MDPAAYLEMSRTEAKHWWFSGRRAILSSIIANIKLPPNAKILEIGCGTGGNLPMLAKFGEVIGLEMDSTARAIALKKTGGEFDIWPGSCPHELPFQDVQFDLICLFDVLEHIEQDRETLVAIKNSLSPMAEF